VGCESETPPPPPPAKVEKTEPPSPTKEEEAEKPPEPSPTPYDPAGRREPFKSLIVEEIPSVEKVILTPEPDEILSPLQEFGLEELKLTGIIIGGLGDYARVKAPDGKSYTINVGTLMGKHEGKVISITDNIVLVKETFRYEGGDVEEVETPIYLNPIDEEKSP
jgi:type IV pilus assembly protein PilP